MKQFFSILFLFVFFAGLSFAQDAYEKASVQTEPPVTIINGEPQYEAPAATIYDNGGLVTNPGGGYNGADLSALQSALSLTIYGFGHAISASITVADDFTVTGAGWQVDQLQFFAYQTGSTTTSTINDVRVQIWNGPPNGGGSVIWGDLTTNRMTATAFTNIYRALDTSPTASNRPIMVQTVNVGIALTPGTYWVEWQTGGTLTSGPWAPPVTILGQTGKAGANALQNISGTWGACLDGTFPQDLPFLVLGSVLSTGYFEDFEAFVVGQQVACQDPTNWTTWSNSPCSPVEDAYISSTYAYSGTKSVKVVQNNDLVKPLGNKTSGLWYISFYVYIPSGKAGYFNTLAVFTPPSTFNWGMECYFDVGGGGRFFGGSATATNFTWTPNSWQMVQVEVNLGTDQAKFWYGSTLVKTWQWTLGANGGGSPLSLAANDFFGATATDEMYFDDYWFADTPIPVELTSFTAIANNGVVELNWETATEVNNQGFEIQRRTETSDFRTIGFIDGHGTTTEPVSYSYTDETAELGINYYRLKQVDYNGTYSYSDIVEADVTAPLAFDLGQNYPNPFNPSTNIKYSVPEASNIRLSVYNIVGEEVAVLVNGFSQAGSFEVTFDASNLSTGVYLYKLQSDNSVQTKKMILLK